MPMPLVNLIKAYRVPSPAEEFRFRAALHVLDHGLAQARLKAPHLKK
jgi:hypothetical protein